MFSEIFYFLVVLNLCLFVWGALAKNYILLLLAVVFTFGLSLLLFGTGIDYHLGNAFTLNASGDVTGSTPSFTNFSPANDKGLWYLAWSSSILSFCMIIVVGYWIVKGKSRGNVNRR